jgi:molybdopterin-biosynthesis enzyme MoeA-like protein
MAHHLVVFADFVRNTGMTLVEAVKYVGDNYDELDEELVTAYDNTYMELMQFCNTQEQ